MVSRPYGSFLRSGRMGGMVPEQIILSCPFCPGDVLTLTAAIESLHAIYPGRYATDTRTYHPYMFENNPHITPLGDSEARVVAMDYPMFRQSNVLPLPFLRGFTDYLGKQLGVPLDCRVNRPCLYLSKEEAEAAPQVQPPYIVINAGIKSDFTCKAWPVEYYQAVVDAFHHRIRFVQIGESCHNHPPLENVLSLVDQTPGRKLIMLAYHAFAGVGPDTYLMHLMAAWRKPYFAISGGKIPVQWIQYPYQQTFHSVGQLPCNAHGACWCSRVVPLGDGTPHDQALCKMPVDGIAACMKMIEPQEVSLGVERLLRANGL